MDEFCADGDEFSSLIKNWVFLEQLNECQPYVALCVRNCLKILHGIFAENYQSW